MSMNKLLMIVMSSVLLAGCAPTADQTEISIDSPLQVHAAAERKFKRVNCS